MKTILGIFIVALIAESVHAQYFSDVPDADAFVRASAPSLNYGAAGALSVSGASAVNGTGVSNGAYDTFIRFNAGALINSFNSTFGSNNWVITVVALQLTEQAAPSNPIFNRGVGTFQVRWIAHTNWTEGTGTPALPTTDGISYSSETGLLNSNTDEVLGTFTNSGANQTLFFYLTMSSGFVKALKAGAEVDLYLTATSPNIGFTFDSKEFGTTTDWPFLDVSAFPQTGITGIHVSGKNIVLTCTNGFAGETYYTLAGTNANSALAQWPRVSTNRLSTTGNFTITVTNGAVGASPKYFTLQAQ